MVYDEGHDKNHLNISSVLSTYKYVKQKILIIAFNKCLAVQSLHTTICSVTVTSQTNEFEEYKCFHSLSENALAFNN